MARDSSSIVQCPFQATSKHFAHSLLKTETAGVIEMRHGQVVAPNRNDYT